MWQQIFLFFERINDEGRKLMLWNIAIWEGGCHGLPKVSPRPAMPNLSTLCGWATPKMALRLFQGWLGNQNNGKCKNDKNDKNV
jgi:hypothetical protein